MGFSHLCKVIIRAAVVPIIGRNIAVIVVVAAAVSANKHCESIGTCKTSSKHESNVVLMMNAETIAFNTND